MQYTKTATNHDTTSYEATSNTSMPTVGNTRYLVLPIEGTPPWEKLQRGS